MIINCILCDCDCATHIFFALFNIIFHISNWKCHYNKKLYLINDKYFNFNNNLYRER